MPHTTYFIDTTLRSEGKTHKVKFSPHGGGRPCYGYISSYEQYKHELNDHLTSSELTLYTISSSGEAITISSDTGLCKAVSFLPRGGELAVTAIKRSTHPKPYGPYRDNVHDIMECFDVPGFKHCHYKCRCIMKGVRYFWKYDHNYCLCYRCYKRLSRSERARWKKSNKGGAPWEKDVPDAPLYHGCRISTRDSIRHLQYVLCRLGFMPLSAVSRYTGQYGPHTKRAVCAFRKKYGVRGHDYHEYDERTEKKMAEIVRRFRREGAHHI